MEKNLREQGDFYVDRTFTGEDPCPENAPGPGAGAGGGQAARQDHEEFHRYVRPRRHGPGGGYHGSQLISQTAPLLPAVVLQAERYLRYGFMGMDVLANLVNMAKAQGLYTIVDARTAAPAVYVEGGIRADGVTVTPYPGSDVCRVGEDKSVFAAVRTGNPSAPEIQNLLSGDRRLYLAAADQMVRHGAALMAETGYVLDVKELRSRAPKAFLLLLGCDGENALPAFDDYGRGALIADTALQYADADAVQAAVRQLKQLVTVL